MEVPDREDIMNSHMLSWELLKSIRELDTRIDELKLVLGDGPCPGKPERRQKIVDRVQDLITLRFNLVYSFMDLNPNMKKDTGSTNPFLHIQTDYPILKRQI